MLWVDALQKLSATPVQSPEDGHAVVASILQNVGSLEEQQRLAFDDLASKDDELHIAESKLGEHVVSCLSMGADDVTHLVCSNTWVQCVQQCMQQYTCAMCACKRQIAAVASNLFERLPTFV